MKAKHKKELQQNYAKKNIEFFLELITKYPQSPYCKQYILEVQRLSTAFTTRLTREQKLLFCKKCLTPWNSKSRKIRFNKKNSTKEYICIHCNHIKKIPYK